MAIFKCKMCGGALDVAPDSTIAQCEYCGSQQTLPRITDERLTSFYERANDLRMSHEFDKAAEIYEKIIEENPTDADAYWSMVLCRYGIDYVEEGLTRKPTINRAQMISVTEDVNYRSAMKYADTAQQRIYEEEAAKIDGASDIQVVMKIVLPLAKPSIITTALQALIYVWHEYIYATTFMTGESKYTLAAGLNSLQATEMTGSWPVFAVASITVSIPVLIIFFKCQKYMTSGLTAGGVKG